MWSKEDEWCILCAHLLLYVYVALREAKAILEERVKKRGLRAGQFASKERVTSSPSTSPVPPNPVKWAVNRWIKFVHVGCSSLLSVLKNNSTETFDG